VPPERRPAPGPELPPEEREAEEAEAAAE
jgi:hypothetical protein